MEIPLTLLLAHFVGDFILQTDEMALNKSKNWGALFLHCGAYILPFVLWGPLFVAVTFAAHFVTDAITSRITSKLWFITLAPRSEVNKNLRWPYFAKVAEGKRHWFFVMIGFDQLIHFATLALTYRFIFG